MKRPKIHHGSNIIASCARLAVPALTTQNVFAKVKKLSSVQYSEGNQKVIA